MATSTQISVGQSEMALFYRLVLPDGSRLVFGAGPLDGGPAVVEILSDFHALNTAWHLAKETNDVERLAELETVGAGRPIVLTLGWKAQGAYSGYYTLESQ